ncbi:phosphopyruvate hydratase [Lyticum sinuosum]|uniref:Enolase n=1 Tax=Lyticum sinuosum TaxID=1332059 RepID=A0AAE5AI22_9RICK|nr:phosphopyruvate hydratase [Lyticum sinuosum]MDZ5761494.1 Enolase [Lyticum sinuosum]
MFKIKKIIGRQVFDARGNPTVEADVFIEDNIMGRSTVPSGTSVGQYEAFELRDVFSEAYGKKGVSKAVYNINTIISDALVGCNFSNQIELDNTLLKIDGSYNKANLGANAILAVSLASAKAFAKKVNKPLFQYIAQEFSNYEQKNNINNKYIQIDLSDNKNFMLDNTDLESRVITTPMFNIINGGQHADNMLDIQEFMIVPVGGKDITEKLKMANEITNSLKQILINKELGVNVGDEGGFAPRIQKTNQALDILKEAIKSAGYNDKVRIAIDVAASEFWKNKKYSFEGEELDSIEMIDFYCFLIEKYPEIMSIEDPFADQDIIGWQLATKALGNKVLLVGDDLFVTNVNKIYEGLEYKIGNSILIKPNQIGTLSETIAAIQMAYNNKYIPIISHRSGETEDTTIAHLAVAVSALYIKTGALCRGERVAKYNELLRIDEYLSIQNK